MADIAPFRALRYNAEIVGDIGRVLAPPYDVIPDAERDRLHSVHEHNVIRLILGRSSPEDRPGRDVYARARQIFQDWQAFHILRRDEQPRIYLYEQTFSLHEQPIRRLGFIALLRLDEASSGVFRHEQTFQGPKTDREQLLQSVRANLSPIFCLFSDETTAVYSRLRDWTRAQAPVVDARFGDEHDRLWHVSDPAAIQALRTSMWPKALVIADGHHRYEVALANRRLSPYVMSYFGWLEDPAMVVLPIHRMVPLHQACTLEAVEQALSRHAQVAAVSDADTLFRMLGAGREAVGLFGLYAGGKYRLLRLQSDQVEDVLARHGVPAAWSTLDVALLHYVLLPELVNGSGGQAPAISYTKDVQEAVTWADGGAGRVAFLLNPVPLRRIQEIALQGHRLPHKSTYFYPKLLSGLVINPFD